MSNEITDFDPGALSNGVMLSSLEPQEIASLLMSTATVGDLREIMAHSLEMCKVSTHATHIQWFTGLLRTIMAMQEKTEVEVAEETAEELIKRIVANQIFLAGYGELVQNELAGYVDKDLR